MTNFELLSVMLMFIGIIVVILIEYIIKLPKCRNPAYSADTAIYPSTFYYQFTTSERTLLHYLSHANQRGFLMSRTSIATIIQSIHPYQTNRSEAEGGSPKR